MSYKSIPILMPQTYTLDQIIQIRTENFTDRRTLTQSHDEAIQLVNLGGDGSYIIIYDLELWPVENQNQLLALPHQLRYLSPRMIYRPCLTQNVTQAFNINPENYPMWQPPGHMGIDLGVYAGDPYYATQKGVVKHASNKMWSSNQPSAYGYNVVIDHGGYHTLYAHAKSNLPVSVGDIVQAGQIVGYSGNTGTSDGYHLHYSVLVNYDTGYHKTVWGWFTDPTYVISLPAPSSPPPSGTTYDLLDYIKGNGTLYEVRNSKGGQERFQTQTQNQSEFWQTKNSLAEQLYVDSSFIYRGFDTSPGADRYYIQEQNGQPRAKWLKRYMKIGDVFSTSLDVALYNWGCGLINRSGVTDQQKLVAYHETFTFSTGITLNDVIFTEWVNGGESYGYAKGYGLVAWGRSHTDPNTPEWSVISEIHQPGQRPDNQVNLPPCL